jgi:hypothetical protein
MRYGDVGAVADQAGGRVCRKSQKTDSFSIRLAVRWGVTISGCDSCRCNGLFTIVACGGMFAQNADNTLRTECVTVGVSRWNCRVFEG